MSNRRTFMAHSAAAATSLAFPLVAGAQAKTVKVGVLHPVTGALAYSGQQCRMGALMAIKTSTRRVASSLWAARNLKPCSAMPNPTRKRARPKSKK